MSPAKTTYGRVQPIPNQFPNRSSEVPLLHACHLTFAMFEYLLFQSSSPNYLIINSVTYTKQTAPFKRYVDGGASCSAAWAASIVYRAYRLKVYPQNVADESQNSYRY